jgi:hypothetical protein
VVVVAVAVAMAVAMAVEFDEVVAVTGPGG